MMNSEWGMSNGEWGQRLADSPCAHDPHSPFPTPHSRRPGVTLIELLITMAIMAIISAAILGTASSAMEAARRDRTRVLVTKISDLINQQMATYETRRIPLRQSQVDAINTKFPNATDRGKAMADLRLLGLRELIKLEMPDHWTDIEEDTYFVFETTADRPSVTKGYLRKLQSTRTSNLDEFPRHQSAECLYLTVMNNTADGEARTLFNKNDIDDVDGDGANEFVDGWGNPISWIRWPAGFAQRSALMSSDASVNHDPLDVYRRDDPSATPPANLYPTSMQPYVSRLRDPRPAFRTVPLVYSAGADGTSNVNLVQDEIMQAEIFLDPYSLMDQSQPYHVTDNPFRFGVPRDDDEDGTDNSIDNYHNHLIEY